MTRKSNQLQNHPKFITVHGSWPPHTIPEQGTMDQGDGGQGSGFALLSKKLSRIAERVEYSIRIPFSALDKICSSM